MWRAGGLIACAIVIATCCGCGPKVSARVEQTTVTKWKYQPKSAAGIPKGLIVEQKGEQITARFCDLKAGDGFEVETTLARGRYIAQRNALVFPLGMPDSTSLEQWLQIGGPHLAVPFDPKSARLVATLAASGTSQSYEFVPHPRD